MIRYVDQNAFSLHSHSMRIKAARATLRNTTYLRIGGGLLGIALLVLYQKNNIALMESIGDIMPFILAIIVAAPILATMPIRDFAHEIIRDADHAIWRANLYRERLVSIDCDTPGWCYSTSFDRYHNWIEKNCQGVVSVILEDNPMVGYQSFNASFASDDDLILFRLTFK